MNYENSLNEAIKEYDEQLVDTELHAKNKFESLKAESEKLFKLILNRIKPERKNDVKIKINYGDCRPTESNAYVVFGDSDRVYFKFDKEMFRLLAFYIDKTNRH